MCIRDRVFSQSFLACRDQMILIKHQLSLRVSVSPKRDMFLGSERGEEIARMLGGKTHQEFCFFEDDVKPTCQNS